MRNTVFKVLTGFWILSMFALEAVAQQMPKKTTETIKHSTTSSTQKMHGTVVVAEDNRLVVKMSNGELKTFDVPEGKTALVDGKALSVNELKPGTTLDATITTSNTSLTERTTTVGTGKVFYVAGNTVILTLPNNENRMYKVQDTYKFVVDDHPATVSDLRKGMTVSAQKIVEEPRTEIATNSVVTGHAPPPPMR